jgi:ABC-type antimicrobial peptide transport system permease subunit
MTGFAVAALLLAVSGVYGVVAYIVGQRTKEVGIRMALGSSQSSVLWLMLRLGLAPVAFGVVLGIGLAYWGGRYLTSLLYGVAVTDPVNVASMIGALSIVAVTATLIPAWRATRVSPSVALRGD